MTHSINQPLDQPTPLSTDTDRTLLILHRLLAGPCSANELLDHLRQARIEILPDTLYRDINKLRRNGYQIPKATKRTQGRYIIEKLPFHLPFSRQEVQALQRAVAIAVQLKDPSKPALEAALARLSDVLPAEFAEALQAETQSLGLQEENQLESLLSELETCCQQGQQIKLFYSPLHGKPRPVTLEPVELAWLEGHWYLIGYDCEKSMWKELRLERIFHPIEILPCKRGKTRVPQYKAVFRMYPPLAEAYEARRNEQIEPDPAFQGSIRVTTLYHSDLRLCQRLLRYEQYVEVLSPLPLRQRMERISREIAGRYQGSNQDSL